MMSMYGRLVLQTEGNASHAQHVGRVSMKVAPRDLRSIERRPLDLKMQVSGHIDKQNHTEKCRFVHRSSGVARVGSTGSGFDGCAISAASGLSGLPGTSA